MKRRHYINPPEERGAMFSGEGQPVMAQIEGGPHDGKQVQMQHIWTLGRNAVELVGEKYVLGTNVHGWTLAWAKEA